MSEQNSGTIDVFLGGSCNPTTWRKDLALPRFELAGLTYYNPQVDDWTPDLVDIEAEAKRVATVLLFCIDGQTRAISSLVEVAAMAAAGRVASVSIDMVKEGDIITEQPITAYDAQHLNAGRLCLSALLTLCDTQVGTLPEALETVVELRSAYKPQQRVNVKEKLQGIADATLTFPADMAPEQRVELLASRLKDLTSTVDEGEDIVEHNAATLKTVIDFLSEGRKGHLWYSDTKPDAPAPEGGSSWLWVKPGSDIAVARSSISVLLALVSTRLESASVIVSNNRRHICTLVDAGFLSGTGLTTRLHVEDIPAGVVLEADGETIPPSPLELKDLNRGRSYLKATVNDYTNTSLF
eukprot:m.145334 g.145334  ORF g.145334 m.145334 type:complete len:353 (-) comp14140_c0_seq5:503-1561(-)